MLKIFYFFNMRFYDVNSNLIDFNIKIKDKFSNFKDASRNVAYIINKQMNLVKKTKIACEFTIHFT